MEKIKGYLSEMSLQMRADAGTYKHVKNQMSSYLREIYQVKNLPTGTDPKEFYPTAVELHRHSAFGKNNCLKSFTVRPNLANVSVVL